MQGDHSVAWSIGKTDRCKLYYILFIWATILKLFVLVKMTAEIKRNMDTSNVSPNTYNKNLTDKKKEPQWTMSAKLNSIDKRIGPSP